MFIAPNLPATAKKSLRHGHIFHRECLKSATRKNQFAIMRLRRGRSHAAGCLTIKEMKMERVVAIKRLGKMLGKSLGYRVDPKAPTREEREEAHRQLPALTAAKKEAEKAMADRREAILAADKEYQDLVAAWKEAKLNADKAFSLTHHFKFTVGTSNGMFFHVKAQGDSWEDVIEKLDAKAA
jgi:hypothetical protein